MKHYTRKPSNRVRISITAPEADPIHITITDCTLSQVQRLVSEVLQKSNIPVYEPLELRGERYQPTKVEMRQYEGRIPVKTVSITTEGSTPDQIAKLIETLFV